MEKNIEYNRRPHLLMRVAVCVLLFLVANILPAKADNVTFRGSGPSAIAMGEQFRLSYTINVEAREFRAPDLSDFDVLMGPSTSTSRSVQISGGQSVSVFSQTYTYILMPKKEGTFNLAPATIKVKNSSYSSNSLVIKVLPANQSSGSGAASGSAGASNGRSTAPSASGIGSNDIFIRMNVSKRNVYEQEGVLVSIKLYSAYDVGVGSIKFPEFEGFLAQDIELEPQWTLENYNGRNYRTAVIKQTVLYPQRSGKIAIEPGRYEVIVRVPSQRQIRSIFDDFMDSYQEVRKEITSSPVTIDVKPLPTTGKPASFSGAVGSYTMNTAINADNVKTNEAVTVKLTISGTGNIKLLKNPEIAFPNDFERYDPKIDNQIKTTATGTSGTKTIEYTAIPRYPGDFEIPAVVFAYFDPQSATYKTLTSQAFKLHVEKGVGDDNASAVVSDFSRQENVKYIGQDIRHIKVSKPHFTSGEEPFFGSIAYLLIYVVIALVFIVLFIIYRKQLKENANVALVRTKKANKTAVRRLKNAEILLKENKKEAFYDEVLRAVWGYLSDKLNIPQSNLTKDNVEAELAKYGVDESLSKAYMAILDTCEFARYAPTQAPDAMDILFKQTVDAIGKMENTIKK